VKQRFPQEIYRYMRYPDVDIRLPAWMDEVLPEPERVYSDIQARMELVIGLARQNVDAGSGGPFGAAIFDMKSGRLIAPGVNLVMSAGCSVLHAEIVAIMIAQRCMGTFDLGGPGIPAMQLVSSTEPCAMCLGAVVWSGVRSLVCGARDADARHIGFDEGPKPPDWEAALAARGIRVVRDVERTAAVAVLEHYLESGGTIYNARQASDGVA
jgi:tRNA(Arg) A34 adenosine deaminase TadA